MNQESNTAIRNVLDAMERTHKRIYAVGWLCVVATLASYVWLDYVADATPGMGRVISAAVLALTCLIAWATFALAIVLTRAARSILRAIELTAARPAESQGDPRPT